MSEKNVELLVAAELESDFGKHQHLLPGREISRRLNDEGDLLVITMALADAPDDAATMSPWFTLSGDRIELGGVDYYDTAGHQLA